jgi:hypothetical protein
MPKINASTYLKTLGFSEEQISEVPLDQLETWSRILSKEPLNQNEVRSFLISKVMAISAKLAEQKSLGATILSFFRLDPVQAILKAQLGICSDLYKLMGYDPEKSLTELDNELKRRSKLQ